MGEILIAGTASLLICVFLSPKFISFLREREFGQHIRDEGPEGHHTKAGTPTMGGIIIFTAISAPFLILSDYDWRAVGVYLADKQQTNMENYGVRPDIVVENTPEDNLSGRDRQLEVAVQELLKELNPKRL